MEYVLSGREEMSEQNYCYQCCLFDICKHIDRGTHTLASPACDAFDPGMRWIPVAERLPEAKVDVLAVVRCKDGTSGVNQGWYSVLNEQWYIGLTGIHATVTHWMPLPDAPEK
jgi:hypothetical protein